MFMGTEYSTGRRVAAMSKGILLSIAAVALGLSVAALGADVNGKWKADFTTPDGTQRSNTFIFKADGEKLTGTVAGTQDKTPIQNGTLRGDEISFTAERPFGKFTYKGKVTGNEIKLKVEFNEQSFEITAKRLAN
jgi:hypothetical protein